MSSQQKFYIVVSYSDKLWKSYFNYVSTKRKIILIIFSLLTIDRTSGLHVGFSRPYCSPRSLCRCLALTECSSCDLSPHTNESRDLPSQIGVTQLDLRSERLRRLFNDGVGEEGKAFSNRALGSPAVDIACVMLQSYLS